MAQDVPEGHVRFQEVPGGGSRAPWELGQRGSKRFQDVPRLARWSRALWELSRRGPKKSQAFQDVPSSPGRCGCSVSVVPAGPEVPGGSNR